MTTATFPVEVDFTSPERKYAKGGLAAKANDVQKAGIGKDKILIHVNQEEYDWLKSQFGPPAKNPETGLDMFGWSNFLDIIIPAASSMILGPIAGSAIGSFLGLGSTVSGVLGGALAGAGGSYLTGRDPLTGAVVGGGAPLLTSALGYDPSVLSIGNLFSGPTSPVSPGLSGFGGGSSSPAGVAAAPAAAASEGILSGMGGSALLKAAPYLLMASALGSAGQGAPAPIPTSGGTSEDQTIPLSNVEFERPRTQPNITTDYAYGPEQQFFENNALPGMPPVAAAQGRYVKGGGTGISDSIPAKLSDGEYVIDAQTVSMLGDGSSDAGATKLDQMRKEIRKHKGKALAGGKFPPKAKGPLSYMKRV